MQKQFLVVVMYVFGLNCSLPPATYDRRYGIQLN